MSPRAIRRAAERRAQKQAQKQATMQSTTSLLAIPESPALSSELDWHPEPRDSDDHEDRAEASTPACSQARLFANRQNARLSSGPRSPEGKSISSLNAVKTGLTGRTVLLPSDDAAAYQRHIQQYEAEFRPVGLREQELVQSLADTQWRLQRIPGLEMAIYSQGRVEFGRSFDDHRPDLRLGMIELQTFLKYEKQLRNLQLQESRLHRRYEKESAELRQLQKARKDQADAVAEPAASVPETTRQIGFTTVAQPEIGFEFSTSEIESHIAGAETSVSTPPTLKNAA